MIVKAHMRLFRLIFLIFPNCFFFFSTETSAQEEKKYVRDGNKAYEKGKYNEAEDQYQKALGVNPGNYTGAFNLGDAYYKEGKSKEAASRFEELTKIPAGDDKLSAKAYHNWGNALLHDKKYEEALEAYKKALTLNPKDEDTRYNLGYTQQMLKQQEQKKNNDKKNDKKDDKKDKQDKKKDQDKKDKDKKDQDKKDKQNDKDKPKPGKQDENQQNRVSKEAAQKMLNEVNNNERKVQNKLKKEKESVQSVKIEKDW